MLSTAPLKLRPYGAIQIYYYYYYYYYYYTVELRTVAQNVTDAITVCYFTGFLRHRWHVNLITELMKCENYDMTVLL